MWKEPQTNSILPDCVLTLMKSKNLEQNLRVTESRIMLLVVSRIWNKVTRCTDWISWVQEKKKGGEYGSWGLETWAKSEVWTLNSKVVRETLCPITVRARVGISSLRTRSFIVVASWHPFSSHRSFPTKFPVLSHRSPDECVNREETSTHDRWVLDTWHR